MFFEYNENGSIALVAHHMQLPSYTISLILTGEFFYADTRYR